MRTKIVAAVLVFMLAAANSVFAANSNFQISPPPIAAPEFEAGKLDRKIGLTYMSLSGGGVSLSGYGVNYIRRRALSDALAWDYQVGLFSLNGTSSGLDMSFFTLPMSLNLEYQPIKTPDSSLILFAGPNYSYGNVTIKDAVLYIGGTYWDLNLSLTMYGVHAGGQYSAKLGDFTVSPFIMIQNQQGTADISYGALQQGSTTISAFTTTSFGLDLLYRPWNMTLSSVLQEAAKTVSNSAIKTTIFTLNFAY